MYVQCSDGVIEYYYVTRAKIAKYHAKPPNGLTAKLNSLQVHDAHSHVSLPVYVVLQQQCFISVYFSVYFSAY